jgi:hypothetical protein
MRVGSEILLDLPSGDEEESFLDIRNLKNLARHGEGLRLEFKMKVKFPEKIVKELVAFANTVGGHLFIGVSDAGVLEGVKFVEEEQFLLERAIEKYCFPAFSYRVYRVHIDNGRDILVYQVYESVDKPHFVQLENEAYPICYVRVKDRTIQASKEMKQILRRENEDGISFVYGDIERFLLEYVREKGKITLAELVKEAQIPLWLAARKLVLLVLARVLKIEPGESFDTYLLN